jgi:putative copper resistance protein D
VNTATAAPHRTRYSLLIVLVSGALLGVAAGLAFTATAAVPGTATPGTAVVVGLPLSRALVDLAALVTVGFSFLPAMLGRSGTTAGTLDLARRIAAAGSAVWLAAALTSLVLAVADYAPGKPVTTAAIAEYVQAIPGGKALAAEAGGALVCFLVAVLAIRRGEAVPVALRAAVSMVTLLPLPASGHAALDAGGWVDATLLSMELHVVAAVCWTGCLLAVLTLLATNRALLAGALPRFSRLATSCVFAVGVTGAFNGWFVLHNTPGMPWYAALLTTGYGWILIGKAVCIAGAGALGGYTRFKLLPGIAAQRPTAVLLWVTLEIAVLGIAFGLAAVLVRAPVT